MKFSLEDVKEEKMAEATALKKRKSLISAIESADENAVIAEVKRMSPSAGIIRDADVVETAKTMEAAGACAISVLTDSRFGGCLDDLAKVKAAVKIPVLRKDFIVDESALRQSLEVGADAVLLIVALLGTETCRFVEKAHEIGLEALVEVHLEDELPVALASGARLIGINNRDLRTMKIDLGTTEKLAPKIPKDRIIVAESGIKSTDDLRRMKAAGAGAFLIGTGIMASSDIGKKVRSFIRCE
jgi:indole-3-glycerol phosphate synthase